ncbi:MAG: hypothetical protein ABI548_18620 [Polyangiaceae bacterium]
MHQVGKHWIEFGVLALLGVLATPLACGGVVENGSPSGGMSATGGAGMGVAGLGSSPGPVDGSGIAYYPDGNGYYPVSNAGNGGNPNPCQGCQDIGGAGCPQFCHSSPIRTGNVIGVDDGSDIGIGGWPGYDDGSRTPYDAAGAAGVTGSGGHGGSGGH